MPKITFIGAGSTVFAKNILGDVLCSDTLQDLTLSLYDIDSTRLDESRRLIESLNQNLTGGTATVQAFLGVDHRREALANASYVVNAIQVGGYEPCTVTDFEIPKKYGLRQTIGDTLGIGGIFRGLRTLPVMWEIAHDMEEVCPQAWMLNYSNPMSILTMGMLQHTTIRTVGLCHSVQVCIRELLKALDLDETFPLDHTRGRIAGINHIAWLLDIEDLRTGKDIYPRIKERAAEKVAAARNDPAFEPEFKDLVRLEMMRHFGYYLTESSEHNAEYSPYWIKATHPEMIEEFRIPLDEYPRRCVSQIEGWKERASEILDNPDIRHQRSHEYGSYIIEAMETGKPIQIAGNIQNHGLISNLPAEAVVEVPCLVDRNGIQGCYVGPLPEQCAAINRAHIAVHRLTVEAAAERNRDAVYHAAYLDPHTAAELPLDRIRALCDDLFEAHKDWLPAYH